MLVTMGMGYEEAMRLGSGERRTMFVALGTLNGGVWDYRRQRWKEPPMIGQTASLLAGMMLVPKGPRPSRGR